MKKILVAAVVAAAFLPSSLSAQERAGDAALGALSGALVLGPVGAVAGAVVGYTAGPSISDSWKGKRSEPRRRARAAKPSTKAAPKSTGSVQQPPTRQVATEGAPVHEPAKQATSGAVSTSAGKPSGSDAVMPPVQGFD